MATKEQIDALAATAQGIKSQVDSLASKGETTPTNDTFVTQLQQKLLGQSDIISSENTNLENKINDAIKSVESSQTSSAAAIASQYDRTIEQQRQEGQRQFTTALESQRGYAQNTAALDKLQKDTDTQLKDLEQRKQELILQGQAAAAGKIADMQFQAIQFRQQAQQQVFANLLGMGTFGLQAQQQQTQREQFARQQSFQETQAIANVALQFGLSVEPGDTIESITTRAQPFASEKQKLEIARIRADIAESNAQAAKARQDAAQGALIANRTDLDTLARGAMNSNNASLALIKNDVTYARVVNRIQELKAQDIGTAVADFYADGMNRDAAIREARRTYANDTALQAIALDAIDKKYGDKTTSVYSNQSRTLPGQFPKGGLAAVKPLPPASPEAIQALRDALIGTAFGR